jgi:hypothetical protein
MIGFITDARRQSLVAEARTAMNAVQIIATELAGEGRPLSHGGAGILIPVAERIDIPAVNRAASGGNPRGGIRGTRLTNLLAADGIDPAWITHITINEHGAVIGIFYNVPTTRAAGTGPTGTVRIVAGGKAEIDAPAPT